MTTAVIAVLALTGCGPLERDDSLKPALPQAFGVRVTDGHLKISTGTPCMGATSVSVTFDTSRARWELFTPMAMSPTASSNPPDPGVDVHHLTVGVPVAGLTVGKPLPEGFDFRAATTVMLTINGPQTTWPRSVNLEEPLRDSAQHPDDTYWFDGVGWLNPAEVAEKNGKEFLAYCTPNPDWDSEVRLFGVRVNDGDLRIWTGSPCRRAAGAIVTFEPGPVDWILSSNDSTADDLEFLTVGKAPPGVPVNKPLPPDFDWRAEKSVVFRLWADGPLWTKPTDLATPAAESSQHPDDTYYFQGLGWLGPAEVATQGAKTICLR